MARKSETGKFIISAGEVGAYTVCPEAWRLKSVAKAQFVKNEQVDLGRQLHAEWAKNYEEALLLARGVRIIVALLVIAVVCYLFI